MEQKDQFEVLKGLRAPFPANQISKLPKPTKKQTEEVAKDYTKGIRCDICGGWHHPKVVHLDYVGHAALTDRLLDVDPLWSWEPLAFDERGLPAIDKDGGLWIRLTVCGMSRIGYGAADGKTGGDAMKERIGDALRNAAMRFGAALDLWHKGVLHMDEEEALAPEPKTKAQLKEKPEPITDAAVIATHVSALEACKTLESLKQTYEEAYKATNGAPAVLAAKNKYKKILELEQVQ